VAGPVKRQLLFATATALAMAQRANRPWLTAASEQVLRRFPARPLESTAPLENTPRRLLVVKVHGLGDSVLIRLIIEQLKSRHAELEIGVLAGDATVDILTLDSAFRVHMYSQKDLSIVSVLATLRAIRRCHYEAVLNFEQVAMAGTAFLALAGIPIRLGFLGPGEGSKARFLTHARQFDHNQSMWETFQSLARLVDPGLSARVGVFPIRCEELTWKWVRDWWDKRIDGAERPVAFHVGSARGMDFRRWPLERFVRLAEELRSRVPRINILLTGTEAEKEVIGRFATEYSGCCVDASALGSIERTIAILKRCELLISNDTGIMHLGAAIGVPTVGLFGPNTPRHWAPVGPRATYVYDTTATCSPCIDNYRNRLPTSCSNVIKSRCMYDISVDSVLSAIRRVVTEDWMI
jgi:ADP-heptose:LPS heptosyltransferase